MAVVEVTLQVEESGIANGAFTGRRLYQVIVDDAADTSETARTADDIPEIGELWSIGHAAKAVSQSAKKVENATDAFEVEVQYSTDSRQIGQSAENPLDRDTVYTFDDQLVTEPFFIDEDGNPVVNSAGDPFDENPSREVCYGFITIERNTADYDDALAESLRNTTNDAGVTILGNTYATGKLRMIGWTAKGPITQNGTTYFAETIRLAKRAAGWDLELEDRGLNELRIPTGETEPRPSPILDAAGYPVVQPHPLDGAGGATADPTDVPATLTFTRYAPADWSAADL